jgi:hypothetical protein
MKRNLQDIDNLFTDVLKDHLEDPPENTWQQIENDLNRRDAEKYKAKYYSLRRTLNVAALIFACLILSDALQFVASNQEKKGLSYLDYFANNRSHNDKSDVVTAINSVNDRNSKENLLYTIRGTNELTAKDDNDSKSDRETIELLNEDMSIISIPHSINNSLTDHSSILLTSESSQKNLLLNQLQKQLSGSNQNQTKKKHDFYIVPFASLDHIDGRLQEEYEYGDENVSDYTKREQPDRSYTVGLLFEYELSKKISLQSGSLISNAFTSVSPTIVKAMPDNSGTYKFKLATTYGLAEIKKTGITDPQNGDSILVNDAMIHLTYFSIPVLMKVNLKQGKFNVSGTAGLAFNKITGDKAEVNYTTPATSEMETVEKIEGVKNSFFSVIAGAEATYSLSKNISTGINPVVRYSITPVNKGTPVKTYPISVGLGATVRIKL